MSVKVYTTKEIKASDVVSEFYGYGVEVVKKSDHDAEIAKLEARCKELQDTIKDITSHYQPEEIAAAKARAEELRLKLLGEMAITQDFKRLESQNTLLQAKLDKCKEQRDDLYERIENIKPSEKQHLITFCNNELSSITTDSIKRGEK